MIHACGHTMYRTGSGEYVCPRCEAADSKCPVCDGYGHTMRGRLMTKCKLCQGTGHRTVLISGSQSVALTDNYGCAVSVEGQDYDSLVAASSWTGHSRGWHTTKHEA